MLTKFRRVLPSIWSRVREWSGVIGGYLLLLIVVITVADITMRMSNMAVQGLAVMTMMVLVVVVWLSMAWGQFSGRHVRVDIFLARTRGKFRLILEAFGLACGMFIMSCLTVTGTDMLIDSYIAQQLWLGIKVLPLWPSKAWVPIGALLFFIELSRQFVNVLCKLGAKTDLT